MRPRSWRAAPRDRRAAAGSDGEHTRLPRARWERAKGRSRDASVQFLLRLLTCVAFCEAAAAQDGPEPGIHETVAAYLEQNAYEVALSAEGGLEGPAKEWFRAEAAGSQFVFIGEEHDVREVPILVGALWRELVPLGYEHVAIEAGPWLGDRLDKFARFADRQALSHFQGATWPRLPNNSVPPISEEDVAFYAELGSVSGPHRKSAAPLIWGLDAEYRAAPLLKRLAELSPRVMFRLGAYRAARGLMHDFGTSTLANFVAELAVAERTGMLNLAIINCRDTSPGDFPRPCTWEQQRALRPFRSAAVADWTLFDLRGLRAPLRQARLNGLQFYPDGWEYWDLVMSFDAVILLDRSEPSRLPGE